jgi:hypothetical protein
MENETTGIEGCHGSRSYKRRKLKKPLGSFLKMN